MSRTFKELYLAEAYPAMSHPSADPATNAEIARNAGLDTKDPSNARILEIGCATGHHILSLASRWPGAECTGMDISAKAISRARSLARRSAMDNVRLCECSLLDFEPEGEFDQIIAHGFFSWVTDEVKIHLLDFIGKHLVPNGIATVSFNVAAGWKTRMPVVEKVRAIQVAGETDEMTALGILKTVADAEESAIIDDMLAKGAEVLAFDDFAPVMDAWSLGAFRKLGGLSGLKILGETGDDLTDEKGGRTFRTELLCRADADLEKPNVRRPKVTATFSIPDFPKLNPWRMTCVQEGVAIVDAELIPCVFNTQQLLVMAAMDGSKSHVRLAEHARDVAPGLDFVAFLKHISDRGMFS